MTMTMEELILAQQDNEQNLFQAMKNLRLELQNPTDAFYYVFCDLQRAMYEYQYLNYMDICNTDLWSTYEDRPEEIKCIKT